jgi:Phage integrase family
VPGIFSLHFARLVQRSEVPKVRFHDLRHGHATLALAGGADLKTVSASLGRSTISTTANIYLHVVDSLQKAAADRLDHVLGPAVGDALRISSVPQRRHATRRIMQKSRGYGLKLVAPTGVEPVSQP